MLAPLSLLINQPLDNRPTRGSLRHLRHEMVDSERQLASTSWFEGGRLDDTTTDFSSDNAQNSERGALMRGSEQP